MVATLLGLKLRLTIGDLKRSTARLVLWIILAVYALGMIAAALIGLIFASLVVPGHEVQTSVVTVVAGSVVVLGWIVFPLVFFGSDQTLDPSRFAPFPLTGRQLAMGLTLASVLGVPGFATAVLSLGSALPWIGSPVVVVVGLVGGALGFVMSQIGCRLASALAAGSLSSRKAKDRSAIIGVIVVIVLSGSGYAISLLTTWFSNDPTRWHSLLSHATDVSFVLSWTPLGAPWALAGDAGQGQWLVLLAHLIVTCAYVALGLWAYAAVLDKALVAPQAGGSSGPVSKSDSIARAASWPWAKARLIPVAAIAARSMRYWRRDPRYVAAIPSTLLMLVLFTVIARTMPMMSADDSTAPIGLVTTGLMAFGLGYAAIMLGYALSGDVASDSTAWWIHLASGVRGWQDRLGRVVGQLVWALPVVVAVSCVAPLVFGNPDRILTTLGAMVAFYLAGLAVSSVFSALIIYPVALPGESPMKMKTNMMGSQMLSQLGCMVAAGVLGLPTGIWAIFATGWTGWLVLLVSLVWGAGLLVAGVVLGGKIMDSRGPAILQALTKNDSRQRS